MSPQLDNQKIEVCPDDHHCLNGSICVENPYQEGSYYCDCREVDFEAAYEGLRCEHEATVYCVSEGVSKHSFCTNNGICVEIVGPDSAHMGCECLNNYEGSYCQFVKGTKPKGYPFLNPPTEQVDVNLSLSKEKEPLNSGFVTGFIILFICSIAITAAIYARLKRPQGIMISESGDFASPNDNIDGRDLSLEADGGGLIHVMESMQRNKNNESSKIDII